MHSISSHASELALAEDAGLAGLDGVAQACGAVALGRPADAGERGARLGHRDRRLPRRGTLDALGLCQQHRAELAGADQADSDRAATGCPLLEHG